MDLFTALSFRFSSGELVATAVQSIHLACWSFLLPFISIIDFSRELGLHIMCAYCDNLNLLICTSSENFRKICTMVVLFICLGVHDILRTFLSLKESIFFLSCFFKIQFSLPWSITYCLFDYNLDIGTSLYLHSFSKLLLYQVLICSIFLLIVDLKYRSYPPLHYLLNSKTGSWVYYP